MSRTNEILIKEAIRQMLERYHLSDKINEINLIASWDQIAGPLIARHTKKLKIYNKVLFIEVDSAALRNELTYARTKLLNQLNKKAGKEVILDIIVK
jgi:predicted nucleic acid-binding Zn ribbon protein